MQKTDKLYYKDAEMMECEATVLECTGSEGKYKAVLDRTCMFPLGGGQPSDTGFLDDAKVFDVREDGEILYHFTDTEFAIGQIVKVRVDKERRLDHNCMHTGEHMISGIAKELFGAINVGFHMADDYATLDFDIVLDDAQIHELERAANIAVRDNRPIHCDFVDVDGLKKLTLRKKTDGIESKSDIFRIVYIDGVDSCTCCGSHCNNTGEVGIIKISSWQKFRSGVRIWFVCGQRAFDDYMSKQIIADTLSKRFSTKQSEVVDAVIKQGDENAKLKRALRMKTAALALYQSKDMINSATQIRGTKIVLASLEDADMQELRLLCENCTENGSVLCMLFSVCGSDMFYALAATDDVKPKVTELCKTVNAMLNGKGGGKGNFVQGKAAFISMSQLSQSLEQLNNYVVNAINR